MEWIIPGTTLSMAQKDADLVCQQFQSLFLAGGLTLSQMACISGLETYTIQNWVKRRFLPPPQNKRYGINQLCRVLNMNILRGTMPLEQIIRLMEYLNGDLADERDDLVDDSMLFFFFVRLAARVKPICEDKSWEKALEQVTASYTEKVPGARQKLIRVLKVMLTVWCANCLKAQAEEMIAQL